MYSLNRIITDNESMYIKWKNSLISACISTLYVHMYRYIAILVFGIFRNSWKLEKPFMRIFALYIFPQLYLSQVFQNIKIFNVIINLPEYPPPTPPNNTSLIVNITDLYIFREKTSRICTSTFCLPVHAEQFRIHSYKIQVKLLTVWLERAKRQFNFNWTVLYTDSFFIVHVV